ncbi:hypothetical protein [Magnetovibrio blakemorei]|uniref:HTH cro/C1-type domain-containing protein n=1 Tax=Magnetovibrio blakemorei TaxID=28181 RepID=A0A1E5Q308_9PROT|nr:hypothetical protein [Magnetovibrio blakemorei]OEJ63869.1 hypothetical protein BEN30_17095 [Magnetovibrio blakemorei]
MGFIIHVPELQALRQACDFYGGIRAVALKAGIQNSNLSRWLKGEKTLSNQSVIKFLAAIDIPEGKVDTSKVLEWSINWIIDKKLSKGIELYFPEGEIELARAPWSRWGLDALLKQAMSLGRVSKDLPPEIYAMKQEEVRVVLRRTPGVPLTLKEFGGRVKWKEGSLEASAINISMLDLPWIDGGLSPDEFDRVWEGKNATMNDIVAYIENSQADTQEVLNLLKKKLPIKR